MSALHLPSPAPSPLRSQAAAEPWAPCGPGEERPLRPLPGKRTRRDGRTAPSPDGSLASDQEHGSHAPTAAWEASSPPSRSPTLPAAPPVVARDSATTAPVAPVPACAAQSGPSDVSSALVDSSAPLDSFFGEEGVEVLRILREGGANDGLRLDHASLEDCCGEEEGVCQHRDSVARSQELGFDGGNKKKRKVPGVSHGVPSAGSGAGDDDRTYQDGDSADEEPAPSRASQIVVPRAPPTDIPTTAKAALAKLRHRPPHVSLSPPALSHRRHLHHAVRLRYTFHEGLVLPQVVPYVAPAGYSTGPPPLPPGSGLKGSKALKAAKKAEKEREKENARMKAALGGATIQLAHLWDPTGLEARRQRAIATVKPAWTGAHVKSGYLTPPASASSEECDSPRAPRATSRPVLDPAFSIDEFVFAFPSSATIVLRWERLQQELERVRLAKIRASTAWKEEKQARKWKEEEAVKSLEEARKASTDGKKSALPPPRPPCDSIHTGVHTCDAVCDSALPPLPPLHDRNNLSNGPPPRKGKGRRKRSALANAGNSHHRDNYVPSRTPSAPAQHQAYSPNASSSPPALTSWPASPEALLAAGRDPKFFAGDDEWLCSFCEYKIWFSEDPSCLSLAKKQRRKVLKVRKRAQERAARTTYGPAAPPAASPS